MRKKNRDSVKGGNEMATAQRRASGKVAGHKAIGGTLDKPLLEFDLNSEIEGLHGDAEWSQESGRCSRTLVKHADLRIVLMAMRAKAIMHEHTAAGRISVQTLSGHIQMKLPKETVDLPAGRLLALDQCLPHDVEALEDSAFLLTLSWPPEQRVEECKTKRKK
jgi:quercetin dioxygenase-like cupin family protein